MTEARHSLLRRQLRRHFPGGPPPELEPFLADVDGAYHASDADRGMVERALELSSDELLAANAQLRAVMDAFPDQFVWVDARGTVVRIHGDLDGTLAVGGPFATGPDPDVARARGEAIARVRATGAGTTIGYALRAAGGERHYEARIFPLLDGRLIVMIVDVTKRKQAEREIVAARDAAEAATRAKSQFLAMMSHELRTPMNAMIGMCELLLATKLGPEQKRMAEVAHQAGESLLAIIGDILDYSRIEAGRLAIERLPVDLRAHLAAVLEMLATSARAKGLRLRLEVDPAVPTQVQADPVRVRQVVMNLLSNAIKFTAAGDVVVRVRLVPGDGPAPLVHIEVQDHGIGISADVRARLFQPFMQADTSTTRRFGGTGLGLIISKHLVGAMGGEIDFDSSPGAGTTFWFRLPIAAVAGEAGAAEPVTPAAAAEAPSLPRGLCVLVVDDNSVNALVARAMLARFGCDVRVAENGRVALAALRAERFDAVLMDCQMPEMDGFEATARIRALEDPTTRLPIIALTANAMEGDEEICRAAGMDDYLTKPVRPAQLRASLARLVGAPARGTRSSMR